MQRSGLKSNGPLLWWHAAPTPPSRVRANTAFLKLHLQQGVSLWVWVVLYFLPDSNSELKLCDSHESIMQRAITAPQ